MWSIILLLSLYNNMQREQPTSTAPKRPETLRDGLSSGLWNNPHIWLTGTYLQVLVDGTYHSLRFQF